MSDEAKPFQILALSGGGYRGLYTAQVLADLEKQFGAPIGKHFDLITGTSVGGIIALAVSLEIPMQNVVDLFVKYGHEIFKKRSFCSRLFGIRKSPYTADGLKALLKNDHLFGDKLLADVLHPVLIPSINYTEGKPVVLKTPHHLKFKRDWEMPLVDVALATSAAPTYFPRHIYQDQQFVDGGLCANDPSIIGLHEADNYFNVPLSSIRLLSIGTLSSRRTVNDSTSNEGGMIDWAESKYNIPKGVKNIIDLTLSSQQLLMRQISEHRLELHNGLAYVIDELLTESGSKYVALDQVNSAAQRTLIGNAHASSKKAISEPKIELMMTHLAPQAQWFHGPNKNTKSSGEN